MARFLLIIFLVISSTIWAQKDYGYLKKEDQKYFKNDSMEGNNQYERIDLNVKEINKLHAEVAQLKAEMATLKEEVERLKKQK